MLIILMLLNIGLLLCMNIIGIKLIIDLNKHQKFLQQKKDILTRIKEL